MHATLIYLFIFFFYLHNLEFPLKKKKDLYKIVMRQYPEDVYEK